MTIATMNIEARFEMMKAVVKGYNFGNGEKAIEAAIMQEIEHLQEEIEYLDDDQIERIAEIGDEEDAKCYVDKIEIFCECGDCARKSMNPERWRYHYEIDGVVYSDECYQRELKHIEFENLVKAVETVIEESDWTLLREKIAQTGTHYFTVENPNGAERKIRVANHCECYCTEDWDISPSGYTPEQLKVLLEQDANDEM